MGGELPPQHSSESAGNETTNELTKEWEFSEWTLDVEADDPGLRKERREQWPRVSGQHIYLTQTKKRLRILYTADKSDQKHTSTGQQVDPVE
ncbi:hypothetical protein TNCV_1845741 [Trichonephila clavipes]|nr:hypothetical protein TNCV_1845741 [Trichonephila clavipes]